MLFNSLEFAIFFPVVAALYFLLPQRHRTLLLLVSSCVFYMAFIPAYIVILGITILIDYSAGIWLERTVKPRARRLLLLVSIVATCTVLFVFKYFYFFLDNSVWLAGVFGWKLTGPSISIVLPIGLSFHTFQSLSYVIEVFYRRQKAETNFLTYATYVMFFPQLVAGPIERPQNLLHQFYEEHSFDYMRVTNGLKRMAWGFFKKLVVADRLALYVNDVYNAPRDHNGLQLSLATVFFAYQIYCDFSGYSDIAIGSARVLGFRLMENFRVPYHSRSVAEFWQRWHISLSTWFRDYVYIPLGGNRVARPWWLANILVTFTISGLWHGANWTFVVWGLVNGLYLIVGASSKAVRDRVFDALGLPDHGMVRTILATVTLFGLTSAAWVIFRARTISDAAYIFANFFRGWDASGVRTEQFLLRQLPVALLSIAVLEAVEVLNRRKSLTMQVAAWPLALRWPVYAAFVVCVVLFGIHRQSQFIYFQF
jgi:D-alanyl-lipoteichoic acid acyltransferase DltB (MBOAT superfamily)